MNEKETTIASQLLVSSEWFGKWGQIHTYDGSPEELLEANILGPGNLVFPKSRQTSSIDEYGNRMHLRRRKDGSIVVEKTVLFYQRESLSKHGRPDDIDLGPILKKFAK